MEILDLNKLRLRCENFQEEIEITHSIFDQKIKCNFHSSINHNLQLHKSNMKNINFCWINCAISVIFLCKHFFCPKSHIFIFCYLIQLGVAMQHQAFLTEVLILTGALKPVLKTNFLQLKPYISPTKLTFLRNKLQIVFSK